MSKHGTRQDAVAICPYYRFHDRQKIKCEGLLDNAAAWNNFQSETDKKTYFREYCCSYNWKACPWAQALSRKYE